MDTIGDLAFFPLTFDKNGALEDPSELARLIAHIEAQGPLRLAVASHGWRNDRDEATALYAELFGNVAKALTAKGFSGAGMPTLAGVYWPSMALPEFDSAPKPKAEGGATAAAGAPSVPPDTIVRQLDQLGEAGFFAADKLAEAKALLANLADRPGDQASFVKLLRAVALPPGDPNEDNANRFLHGDPNSLFDRLSKPIFDGAVAPRGGGSAAGLADAIERGAGKLLDVAQGALGSAFRLVNLLTFYQMKERAGAVGAGLNGALGQVRAKFPNLPIHLLGHSFGARVVTAAAARGANLNPCSLSLLQAAFSHNGLAAEDVWDGGRDGYFRPIFAEKRVSGPIIATHTKNDTAVGIAYPIASRAAGQNANALGDADDPFGGIGRNGILHVRPEEQAPAGTLGDVTAQYVFAKGKANNLLADAYVKDHGDIRNREVANAVAQVIASL